MAAGSGEQSRSYPTGRGQPTKPPTEKMNITLKMIRSIAITKANRLQRVHRYIEQLRPAFAEWAAGEIYVCKKTGTYRYRFGDLSKSVTPWDSIARELFPTPEALAFAAMVFGAERPAALNAPATRPVEKAVVRKVAPAEKRANVVELAA